MTIDSLRMRFVLTGGLLLAAIIGCGAWSVITINRFGATLGDTLGQHQKTIDIAVHLIVCLERQQDALLQALHGQSQAAAAELHEERQQFDEAFASLKPRLVTARDHEVYNSLGSHEKTFRTSGDALFALARQSDAFNDHFTEVNHALREAVTDCRYFRESNVEAMHQDGVNARDDARHSSFVVAGVTLAALLISTLLLARLTRGVMQPVSELDQAVEAIRRDELETRVPVRSSDELGRLADGFNRMSEALAEHRRQAEDRFRQMAENIHEIYWVIDVRAARVLYVSPAYEEVWGRTCQSLYEDSHSWIAGIHPEDHARAVEFADQFLQRDFAVEEFRVVRPDGTVRWVRSRAFPMEDQNGNVSRVARLTEDITGRKRTEEALRDSERRWRSLTETLPQLVWTATADGACDYFSTQWTELTGRTESELLGWKWLETLHPEDREPTRQTWSDAVRTSGRYDIEYRIRQSDGQYLWFKTRGVPIRDGAARVVKWFGTCTDISQLKSAEEAMRQARDLAESANRAKNDFLANVSHEIRTPMNAILGMTELTLDTPLNDNQRQCLKTVKSSAENLLRIINDLLDFSRIEAGKLELFPTEFSLRITVGDTVRALSVRACKKGIELVCRIHNDVTDALIGDSGRLRQVLLNLVGNAIKFTESGEVVVEVTTVENSMTENAVELRFTVRDTGIGIPADKQSSIFLAFEQEDKSTTRKYGGTGLGLTIAARLVDQMGGRIVVESQPGRGSTFSFTARFARQQFPLSEEAAPSLDLLDNLKVLVVDDNATNRVILQEWLHNWRMKAQAVNDGTAALKALSEATSLGEPFSVVLLDSRMPDMDGLTVAARIHENPAHTATRLVLLSSGELTGDVARARELGIRAQLLKPIQQSELLETIYRVMNGSQRPRHEDSGATDDRIPMPVATNSASLRVLAADDNDFNGLLLEQLLTRKGHQVQIARDGRQALSLALNDTFDIMLLDIHMPELDGFQVVRCIREQEQSTGKHLPVVAFTARSAREDREKCLAAGMDDFLAKPVQAAALWETIDRVMAAFPKETRPQSLIDARALLSACGGDAEILGRICHTFLNSLPDHLRQLEEALQKCELNMVREAAHKLHGMVSAFSAIVGDVASDLEDVAAEGQFDRSNQLVQRLVRLTGELVPQLAGVSVESLQQRMAVQRA